MPRKHEALTPSTSFDWMETQRSTAADELLIAMQLRDCPFNTHPIPLTIDPHYSNRHLDQGIRRGIQLALNQVGDEVNESYYLDMCGSQFQTLVTPDSLRVVASRDNQTIGIYERHYPLGSDHSIESFINGLDQAKERYVDVFPLEEENLIGEVWHEQDAVCMRLVYADQPLSNDLSERELQPVGWQISKTVSKNTDFMWVETRIHPDTHEVVHNRYRVTAQQNSPDNHITNYLAHSQLGLRARTNDTYEVISQSRRSDQSSEYHYIKTHPGKSVLNREHILNPINQIALSQNPAIEISANVILNPNQTKAYVNQQPLMNLRWGRLSKAKDKDCLVGFSQRGEAVGILFDCITLEVEDVVILDNHSSFVPLKHQGRDS